MPKADMKQKTNRNIFCRVDIFYNLLCLLNAPHGTVKKLKELGANPFSLLKN